MPILLHSSNGCPILYKDGYTLPSLPVIFHPFHFRRLSPTMVSPKRKSESWRALVYCPGMRASGMTWSRWSHLAAASSGTMCASRPTRSLYKPVLPLWTWRRRNSCYKKNSLRRAVSPSHQVPNIESPYQTPAGGEGTYPPLRARCETPEDMRRGAGGGVGLPLPSTTQLIRSLRIFLERLALLPYTWTKLDSSKVCGRTHVKGKTWRYLVPALLCPPVGQCSLSDGDDLSPFCKERTDELLSRSGGPFVCF